MMTVADPDAGEIRVCHDGVLIASCALERQTEGVSRITTHTAVLGPWHILASAADIQTIVRATIRTVVSGDTPWHQVVVWDTGIGAPAIDAAWRYATDLGLACDIAASERDRTATIWSTGAKAAIRRLSRGVGRLRYKGEFRKSEFSSSPPRYFVLDLAQPLSAYPPVALVEVDEAELYARRQEYGVQAELIETALHHGDRCFAVLREDRVLFRMWTSVHRQWISSLIPEQLLQEPTAYVYDCHTAPEARGQGLYTRALLTYAAECQALRQIVLRIHTDNIASIRGALKAGFVEA
jgi:GNAT superfamily N-acetyltransferase